MSIDELRDQWNTLYRQTLPRAAKARSPAQTKWPVFLDHCFARIILDNAVGKDRPWGDVLPSPATKNMNEEQLRKAIELGEKIKEGKRNLVELDQRSLELRGKTKGNGGSKRKSTNDQEEGCAKKAKQPTKNEDDSKEQPPSLPASEAQTNEPETKDSKRITLNGFPHDDTTDMPTILRKIQSAPKLTPFRKATLTLLTQVPRGCYTTYQALAEGVCGTHPHLSEGKKSCARAIGSSMRNNPFPPAVPCHRCLASDGKIGGFGGVWNKDSDNAKMKMRLLREEGVKFDGKGVVVGQPFRDFHA